MKKSGYDQFFKAATQAKQGTGTKPKPAADVKADAKLESRLRDAMKMKPVKKTKPFPTTPLIAGAIFIAAGLGYLTKPDLLETLLRKVEIRFMGQVEAEEKGKGAREKAKDAGSQGKEAAKDAGATAEGAKGEGGTKGQTVAEDLSYIEKLRVRKDELDLREKELNQLEEELQRQKVEVDQRIRQLEQMRRDIASVLKERVDTDETQVNKLVDLYSSMKPKQAADVIGNLHEDLAVQVLGKMKKKNAAEVMNLLSPEKARGLSEKLTGYKR